MVQRISVIDDSGAQVGMTFPKRAKQLISKQRAFWQDETHVAICLLPESKEEVTMVDDFANKVNNVYRDTPAVEEKSNDLLLYIAKKRVMERKRLVKHVVAFLAVGFALLLFYEAISINGLPHPLYSEAQEAIWRLNEAAPIIAEWGIENADWAISEAVWLLEATTTYWYTSPIWYLILGVMLAWGGWIALGLMKRAIEKFKARTVKRYKPDPVALEYQRLKDMAPDEMELSKI